MQWDGFIRFYDKPCHAMIFLNVPQRHFREVIDYTNCHNNDPINHSSEFAEA